MANETKQLTVADLEAAKERHEKMANINAPHNEVFNIAATCIGIVEEMVKCGDLNDKMHFADLHNLWLKAVAAFGGEVRR